MGVVLKEGGTKIADKRQLTLKTAIGGKGSALKERALCFDDTMGL